MLFFNVALRFADAPFERRENRGPVSALHRDVAIEHALASRSMSPKRNPVRSIECVPEGVIVMVMRVERSHHRNLRNLAKRFHLKCGASWTAKSFYKEREIFSDQKSAVANRGEPFARIRYRCVCALADFAHRGETCFNQRRLRNAWIICEGFCECRKENRGRKCPKGPQTGYLRNKISTRQRSWYVRHRFSWRFAKDWKMGNSLSEPL